MSMLDDAADETKDAIKEAQRQRQGASNEAGAAMPLSAVAGEVGDALAGAQEGATGEPLLGAEANAELMDPEDDVEPAQSQPRRDEGDSAEGLDHPREPEDPTQEDPASPELDPSRVQSDPGEDDM